MGKYRTAPSRSSVMRKVFLHSVPGYWPWPPILRAAVWLDLCVGGAALFVYGRRPGRRSMCCAPCSDHLRPPATRSPVGPNGHALPQAASIGGTSQSHDDGPDQEVTQQAARLARALGRRGLLLHADACSSIRNCAARLCARAHSIQNHTGRPSPQLFCWASRLRCGYARGAQQVWKRSSERPDVFPALRVCAISSWRGAARMGPLITNGQLDAARLRTREGKCSDGDTARDERFEGRATSCVARGHCGLRPGRAR